MGRARKSKHIKQKWERKRKYKRNEMKKGKN